MNIYLILIMGILIFDYSLTMVVEYLNAHHITTDVPGEFAGYYNAEKYRQSQRYLKETTQFGMITQTVTTLLTLVFILAGGFNLVDQMARSRGYGEIGAGLIFAAILIVASDVLHVPFSIYETFVIEGKYGFNRTTAATFVTDKLKTWGLTALIGGPLFALIIWFFTTAGNGAWLFCWAAVVFFQCMIICIAPVLILPLFNKYTPMKDGELKNEIERYAAAQQFTISGIFTMDGSRRSSRANAFFTGFGSFKRIVLYDTLIEKHGPDELVAILAHEVGHYKKKHTLKALLLSIVTGGIMFFILSLFIGNQQLFEAFRMEHTSIYASLFFFGFLYAPIEMLLCLFSNSISRKHEFEADAFAVKSCGASSPLIAALKRLSVDNLTNLTPHPLKVFLSYSHPPVLERIRHMKNCTIP